MNRTVGWVVGVLIVAAIIWGIVTKMGPGSASASDYKAVFLTNGQVYFGKVANEAASPVVLTDVFYLQVQQQLQQADKNGVTPAPAQQIQLVKLGKEIHGPSDEMRINKDQVLYIESLKSDGKVVKTITEFKANGDKPVTPTATPEATATTSTKK